MPDQQPAQYKEKETSQIPQNMNRTENQDENAEKEEENPANNEDEDEDDDEIEDEAMKAAMGFTAFTSSTSKNYYSSSKQKASKDASSAQGFSKANTIPLGAASSLPAKPPIAHEPHANKKRRVDGSGGFGSYAYVYGRDGGSDALARAGEEDDEEAGGGDGEGKLDVDHERDDGHGHGEDQGLAARRTNGEALFKESFIRDPWEGVLPRRLPPLSSRSGSGSGSGYGLRS